jgi:peroxidase
VGDLLLKNERHFGLDLPTFNIHRGRDYALASYNDYRELCGLPRAKTWHDFHDVIDPEVRK